MRGANELLPVLLYFVAPIVWLASLAQASVERTNTDFPGESTTFPDGTVTIPLIPYHVQMRRRLEQGLIDRETLEQSQLQSLLFNTSTGDIPSPYAPHLQESKSRSLRNPDQVSELFQGYGVSCGDAS